MSAPATPQGWPEGTMCVPVSPWLCLHCGAGLPETVDDPIGDCPPCCDDPVWLRVELASPIPSWMAAAA